MDRNELMAKRDQILRIAAKRGVKRIRLFGSMARGEAGPLSDVDFLVEFEPGRSLLDQGGLLMDLEELLGCKVDIISEGALRPRYRKRVLSEAVSL
jgi:predicted nucleotidyltransferase